mmetsp:Transcript_16172/g.19761  ORF Transcript_16172/g.19761 Transcript_16172/m.19761 type:complete len:312 (-) Transcript_16172:58-993(-)
MVPLIAILLATSSLLYLFAPQMPMYQVTTLKFVKFDISYSNLAISAKILAGIQIDNANFIGADLHSTIVDIYYPDWNGELIHIGTLKETVIEKKEKKNEQECIDNNVEILPNEKIANEMNAQNLNTQRERKSHEDEDDRGICLPHGSNNEAYSTPFFTIIPRGISTSIPDAVTIDIENMKPKIYLNLLKDALLSRGSLEMLVSGVAHVKSPLGIPLSLGLVCDNNINLTKSPLQIVGRNCLVKSISTGWTGLKELAIEVKESTMQMYRERGDNIMKKNNEKVSDDEDNLSRGDELEPFLVSSEVILDWHDF